MTYVPAMVMPSLAQTWLRGSSGDEMTGIATVRAKIVINERLKTFMLRRQLDRIAML